MEGLGRPVPKNTEPPVKVVGFHVEGATPSPRNNSDLRESVSSGSMSPVMIPPSFQQVGERRSPDVSPRHPTATTPIAGLVHPPASDVSVRGRKSEDTGTSYRRPQSPTAANSAPAAAATLASSAAVVPSIPTAPPQAVTAPSQAAPSSNQIQQQQQAKQQQQQEHPGAKPKQKEMSKAERRALQEAQRAAKATAKPEKTGDGGGGGGRLTKAASGGNLVRNASVDSKLARHKVAGGKAGEGGDLKPSSSNAAAAAAATASRPSGLFAHLQPFHSVTMEAAAERAAAAGIPIECVRLGLQMADGSVRGANARCGAMLDMFAAAARDFRAPQGGKSFPRDFGAALNGMVAFLVSCRPLSPAMGNVIKAVKAELARLATNLTITDGEAKAALLSFLATFAQEKVRFAKEALARQAAARVQDGDVVLTFARSSTVEAVLLAAAAEGKLYSVVVVDSRPLLEGRALLTRLLGAGIRCEYVLISGLQSAMSAATKVMLGAGAVASNGAVLSRVGTALVAMSAAAAHVPVLVCAETYKFHDRVQLDSVTYNELGDPAALRCVGKAGEVLRCEDPNLEMLNLQYDTTPAEFVTVVVTEVGLLPATSVPVVLREYRMQSTAEMM